MDVRNLILVRIENSEGIFVRVAGVEIFFYKFKLKTYFANVNYALQLCMVNITVKPVLSGHPKRTQQNGFLYRLSLNAGQKYCGAFCNTFDLH